MVSETPQFEHDCDLCTYLGRYSGDEMPAADLYYCDPDGILPTVIARTSSYGPDYLSGMVFADRIAALGEAKKRAEDHLVRQMQAAGPDEFPESYYRHLVAKQMDPLARNR